MLEDYHSPDNQVTICEGVCWWRTRSSNPAPISDNIILNCRRKQVD